MSCSECKSTYKIICTDKDTDKAMSCPYYETSAQSQLAYSDLAVLAKQLNSENAEYKKLFLEIDYIINKYNILPMYDSDTAIKDIYVLLHKPNIVNDIPRVDVFKDGESSS